MIAIIASFTVTADNAAAFETIARQLEKDTKANEPGVKLYNLVRSAKDPTQYRMMELYDDQAAVDSHMKSDWFRAAGPKLAPLVEGRIVIESFSVVD
ncbi:MAG: antibiotic biosynthesis monooxygenase [Sphingomonadales bacterium]|nr:antibiotic biosynthesis monooxygenase [Sphingomonadales bacterium]